ncbi:MAG: DUF2281 domain-containing protein [Cyanobacteria bacterium P01_H01_bin.35]
MTQAISQEQVILESLKNLTPQQQQEVLDFIEFLQSKNQKIETSTPKVVSIIKVKNNGDFEIEKPQEEEVISMLEAAQEFVGCLETGRNDLSLKKKELK